MFKGRKGSICMIFSSIIFFAWVVSQDLTPEYRLVFYVLYNIPMLLLIMNANLKIKELKRTLHKYKHMVNDMQNSVVEVEDYRRAQ